MAAKLALRPPAPGTLSDPNPQLRPVPRCNPVGRPLLGNTSDVLTVTTALLGGRTVVIPGSGDDTLRTWDPAAHLGA